MIGTIGFADTAAALAGRRAYDVKTPDGDIGTSSTTHPTGHCQRGAFDCRLTNVAIASMFWPTFGQY
jgi:hypothetical protein